MAGHVAVDGATARIRRYFVPPGASKSEASAITNGARREFEVLRGLTHPGVDRPDEYVPTDTVRYTARKDGYHGGASLAELVSPVVVLAPPGVEVPGWTPAPPQEPSWWFESTAPTAETSLGGRAGEAATIFDVESGDSEAVVSGLLSALDAVAGWTEADPDRELVSRMLRVLVDEGSLTLRTLARAVGRPVDEVRRTLVRAAPLLQEAGASRGVVVSGEGRVDLVRG